MTKETKLPIGKVTISASHEAVIPTGPYQNERFGFAISEEIDGALASQVDIEERQISLGNRVYDLFKQFEVKALEDRLKLERKDFRFHKNAAGELLPSVTTFLNYDEDFFVTDLQLRDLASHGNILERMGIHYFVSGNWITDPRAIVDIYPENWVDYVIVKKSPLNLSFDGWDFPAFLAKYPFQPKAWKEIVINEQDRYGGELDCRGMYEGKHTIADFKRTPDKVKNFCQMACYATAWNKYNSDFPIEQMLIIPAGPSDTKQGFNKPPISVEIEKYYKIAMVKRAGFKKRYGL